MGESSCHIVQYETLQERPVRRLPRVRASRETVVAPWSYLAKMARGTLELQSVEFRILRFLATRPYRAFSRQRIAAAVSTEREPVTEETLGRYIRSLRAQLGFYGDFIQTVPFIGYRFKA